MADDNRVRLGLYEFFVAQGRAPSPVELAAALDRSRTDVEAALQRLADEHAIVLAPGTPYVWMANPLSAIPTSFRVFAAGRTWFGNCIWDALGVIAMLGSTGRVETACPDCDDELVVDITDDQVADGDGIVHYAIPARRWWDDIGFT